MPGPLTDIQQLRTVLGRLDAERLAMSESSDDCMPYVEREDDFQRRLEVELTSRRGKARLLVTGQIGVGKSSEIRRYIFQHARGDSCQIFCDLEKEMQPEHCGAAAVLLAICRDCWKAASSYGGDSFDKTTIRNDMIDRLVDWLKGEYTPDRQRVVFRFHGMEYPVGLSEQDKDSGLLLILGKAALHLAASESKERFGLIPDTLLNQLNRLLDLLYKLSKRHPVVFIDHVDKIRDPSSAKEVLIDAHPQWRRLAASLVMTAPFEYTFGELRNSVEKSVHGGPPRSAWINRIIRLHGGHKRGLAKLSGLFRRTVRVARTDRPVWNRAREGGRVAAFPRQPAGQAINGR